MSAIYIVKADEKTEKLRILIEKRATSPEEHRKRENDLRQFCKDERDQLVGMIIRLDPEEILCRQIASFITHRSEPRDYLIIMTQFFNEVADGNFAVEKDKLIISTLLFPESGKNEGLIQMNYELPELNSALRRALPRLNSKHQKWIKEVLSGKQKKRIIDYFDYGRGYPPPPTFSSLYPNDEPSRYPNRASNHPLANSWRELILKFSRKDSKWEGFKSKSYWWIGVFGGLFLLAAVIRLKSRRWNQGKRRDTSA